MRVRFGLIGEKLGHSFSKGYHNERLERSGIDARYENFELATIDEFVSLRERFPDLVGLNVTVPYKKAVIQYLDALAPEAEAIGAVNTILFDGSHSVGYNTDAGGFKVSLLNWLGNARPKALILGTGGASLAVRYVLEKAGMDFLMVSRTRGKADLIYDDVTAGLMDEYRLVINTTPVGMAPKTHAIPHIPVEGLTSGHWAFDLIYNPEKTLFLEYAEARGAKVKNGLEMLHRQADLAWEIWRKYL